MNKQTNNNNNKKNPKYKPNHQQTRLSPHSALQSEEKQTNKLKTQHKSHPIQSLDKPVAQT